MKIEHQKTVEILKWFEAISQVPRGSKKEERIAQWLLDWAKEHGFNACKDEALNVRINVPASKGYENSPGVIIQGHLDMVCEKTPDSPHDFDKDPIRLVYDGEWLRADRTTLGADNGIAIAYGLTAALDKNLKHPALELLFTSDEETGLTGAGALKPGFVKGTRLLNIDTEKDGVFTVGCAGGMSATHTIPVQFENPPEGYVPLTIEVGGLAGGHSADILDEKANALKLMARTLQALIESFDIYLAFLKGGSADNAIPRDSITVVFLDKSNIKKAKEIASSLEKVLRDEFKHSDKELKITLREGSDETYSEAVSETDTWEIIRVFRAIPHGVYAMSREIKNFVETSNNFANAVLKNNLLKIITSQRSPIPSRLEDVGCHISSVIKLAGGMSEFSDGYPGWNANMESPLLKKCVEVYEKLRGEKPIVETTHGGLECGLINNKYPSMDLISFGPTINNPHSPDEEIHIPSIGKVWDFLAALLESLKD